MVEILKSFAERFKDYTDCFTVIGGAACDIHDSFCFVRFMFIESS